MTGQNLIKIHPEKRSRRNDLNINIKILSYFERYGNKYELKARDNKYVVAINNNEIEITDCNQSSKLIALKSGKIAVTHGNSNDLLSVYSGDLKKIHTKHFANAAIADLSECNKNADELCIVVKENAKSTKTTVQKILKNSIEQTESADIGNSLQNVKVSYSFNNGIFLVGSDTRGFLVQKKSRQPVQKINDESGNLAQGTPLALNTMDLGNNNIVHSIFFYSQTGISYSAIGSDYKISDKKEILKIDQAKIQSLKVVERYTEKTSDICGYNAYVTTTESAVYQISFQINQRNGIVSGQITQKVIFGKDPITTPQTITETASNKITSTTKITNAKSRHSTKGLTSAKVDRSVGYTSTQPAILDTTLPNKVTENTDLTIQYQSFRPTAAIISNGQSGLSSGVIAAITLPSVLLGTFFLCCIVCIYRVLNKRRQLRGHYPIGSTASYSDQSLSNNGFDRDDQDNTSNFSGNDSEEEINSIQLKEVKIEQETPDKNTHKKNEAII